MAFEALKQKERIQMRVPVVETHDEPDRNLIIGMPVEKSASVDAVL